MADERNAGLPPSIAAAWGLSAPPRKGPRRELSLARLVEAGVALADRDGLDAVSMSRVAGELGVSTMALYRYVASKDELLTLMVDAAYGPPPEVLPGEGWREGLSRWAWAERAVLQRHPWILVVPIGGPPITPNGVGWFERGVWCLRDTSLAEGEKLSALLLVTGFVRNEATLMIQIQAAAEPGGEIMPAYGRLLATLIGRESYPALSAALDAGAFDEPDDPDAEFIFGLARVLDGIGVLVADRATSGGLLG